MNHIYSKLFAVFALVISATSASAGIIYDVNRSWSDGTLTASLVGTVDVDVGNYTIQNKGAAPFNSTNLTLTVGGTSYVVNNVLTDVINGSGIFSIQATATQLIFSAIGDGFNPADLGFSDGGSNLYAIGYDGAPGFEVAITSANQPVSSFGTTFPVVWGTAASTVPEPAGLALVSLGLLGLVAPRRKKN